MSRSLVTCLILFATTTSFALPPPNRSIRVGANHHIGDASFVAQFHRPPTAHDSERVRMHSHLSYMHDKLAAAPATRPELAAKRAEILGYLSEYVAKDTTPKNAHLPWRTPVFIDDEGTICAVGYLIERSAGRALPEQIAKTHRYDFIDDIAHAMPEVAAWVEASGLTLDEIASIQPAYTEPAVDTWHTWNFDKHPQPDGIYDKRGAKGMLRRGVMEGPWTVVDDKGAVVGSGTLIHGAGPWTSFYPDGARMAVGRYVDNVAEGAWKIFYATGNLAAEGSFESGRRTGAWRFYYDTSAKTPIALGRFDGGGAVVGTWKHFDASGAVIATSSTVTPDQFGVDGNLTADGGEGFLLDIVSAKDTVKHQIHQGTVGQEHQQLDLYALGRERIYVHASYGHETIYDAGGDKLVRGDDGSWQSSDCRWGKTRKAIAREGDVARLHGLLFQDARRRAHSSGRDFDGGHVDETGPVCRAAVAVAPERAKQLDAMLASRAEVDPASVRDAVLGTDDVAPAEMARMLAGSMSTYLEWPHIDGRFVELFETLAGTVSYSWASGDPDDRSS